MTDREQLIADLNTLDKLFATPETWGRGRLISTNSANVTCRCLAGGIMKVVSNPDPADYNVMLLLEPRAQRVVKALGFDHRPDIFPWNDAGTTNFKAVRAKIRSAIRTLVPTKIGRPRKQPSSTGTQ
jgi:hypothetical protein